MKSSIWNMSLPIQVIILALSLNFAVPVTEGNPRLEIGRNRSV